MIERINDTEAEWLLVLDVMYGFIKDVISETCIKNIVIIPATNSIPALLSKLMYIKSDARKILKNNKNGLYYSWKDFKGLGKAYDGIIDVPYDKDAATVMVYSSGSTGASKGILLTNYGILSTNYNRNIPADPVKRRESFLTMIPIWFSTGIVISIIIPLINGVTAILEPKFSGETFAKALRKHNPHMTLTATSLWRYVINDSKMKKANLSNMHCPITGGEKINESDEDDINRYLLKHGCCKNIQKGYGMCELGGTVTSTSENESYRTKPNGAGYPIHNVIIAAFNAESNNELTYREHGEIRVCSPGRMKEYYKNSKATSEFFYTDEQGRVWGCTGDIGYVDEDGEVFILGRATDSYRREDGKIIYLFDIEDVILQDDAIIQCKVVDIQKGGKTVLVAHLVLREGCTDVDAVIERVRERYSKETIPEYMIPDYYKIRESMPVHSNGKRDVEALKNDKESLKMFK